MAGAEASASRVNRRQPRRSFDEGELAELAAWCARSAWSSPSS